MRDIPRFPSWLLASFYLVAQLVGNTISWKNQHGDGFYGGGISLSSGYSSPNDKIPSARIIFSTIYGNTARDGGGIYIDGTDVPVEIKSSIVAGNSAHTNPDIAGHLTSLGYNLIGNRTGATFLGSPKMQSMDVLGVSSTNLKIDPVLHDNGGSTKPHTLTHALLAGSPAIDAIPLQYCQIKVIFNSQSRMYTDQRSMKRPGDDKNKCDIGAYEYADAPT